MLDKTSDIAIAAESWLAEFEAALGHDGALEKLFHPDSYWRDALALSWTLQTVNGRDDILKTLRAQAADAAPSGFAIDPDRAAPAACAFSVFRMPSRPSTVCSVQDSASASRQWLSG